MPEIKKRQIVIASVLKPVNDIRMSEKIARSLADTGQFEIHVIGVHDETAPVSGITAHSYPPLSRLSFTRLITPWRIFRKINALRPSLLIITTHELIWPALVLKAITGCKIVYDLQENYFRNILHTRAFPLLLRPLLAFYVRLKEIVSSPFIDHYFLAEKNYVHEVKFIGKQYTVLENKLKRPEHLRQGKRNPGKLLFSGTLSETTGVFQAIRIATELHSIDPEITLTLIGYCPQPSTLQRIKNEIEKLPFIHLIGGNKIVPHSEILVQIEASDAGIIAYPDNPSTINSIPTKLYEYLGLRLPILLAYHPAWTKICMQYPAAIVFDPVRIDAASMLETLKNGQFYTNSPTDVFWDSEQPRLVRQILQLLH
jgi:glycosyltransferase involved in cell wall biosynthesis